MAAWIYAPGTGETDLKKMNMSLQQNSKANTTNATNIATNTSAITALQTAGTGLANSSGSLKVSLSTFTNSLAGDVALNNVANYFDGPSVAQPTGASSGTWFVSGTVTVVDTVAATFRARLWDGTTVIAETAASAGANQNTTIALSGLLSSPAGNLRISVKDVSAATGTIRSNVGGNTKDSTISAIRIA